MSAIITAPFGDPAAIRATEASNAAFERAIELGYCRIIAHQFARQARREASTWESPRETALRIVLPKHATFAGHPGGAA